MMRTDARDGRQAALHFRTRLVMYLCIFDPSMRNRIALGGQLPDQRGCNHYGVDRHHGVAAIVLWAIRARTSLRSFNSWPPGHEHDPREMEAQDAEKRARC
ncbi:alkyl hydroperoxide reductase/ Thiol specific antioxidant/ Mal allergen [Mycobacterium lentiflavum]|uniref:Alkyl hydroperoxide reductase/ Thiol specific antioxidant/ Mal allergen n=1 Tax=Mycobacterium lentiflavum TaxID=141349 RepID=A0A0E4H2D7_MYCLN|nr:MULTISPECIES: hypothetical protein [Mycobacterium simiae complex]MEE3064388.1 hypothetical protein [Actinomycetota bacterium]ULP45503.1 hypothetical protein MJO58_27520 [Mycobacterium lentiflavum]CQD24806.1 alkyl hydroperoxide reductase/ Thiol specific antioxidant/ Mal allergen [Mycobacterium lentiflavum]